MPAKVFVVKSGWLGDSGLRLDGAAFGEGGLEARDRIKAGWSWEPLHELAHLFTESRFARTYITDAMRGVAYLTGSDMLLADLKGLLRLSRAKTARLSQLQIQPDWTLISCSGTVGRTVYCRPDMTGIALSHDVIRCAPREGVLPGYLFAFLSSATAQAMIRQQAYGSVIQHIEAAHLTNMPVPRLGEDVERSVHELVVGAATARAKAASLLDAAGRWFDSQMTSSKYAHEHSAAIGVVSSSKLLGRLDAFHCVGWATEVRGEGERLGSIADVSRPGMIKRIYAERGIPFFSGVDLFQLRPTSRTFLRTDEAFRSEAIIRAGQIVVQRSGQRYGLLGRPALVGDRLDGACAGDHLFRVTPLGARDTGRIFAFLRSEAGRRQVVGQSYGTSIPCFNGSMLRDVRVPELPKDLTAGANEALALRESADKDEEEAITEVEKWLG